MLDGHAIELKIAHRAGAKGAAKSKSSDSEESSKLVVRNIAFEATKQDIRELFRYTRIIVDVWL